LRVEMLGGGADSIFNRYSSGKYWTRTRLRFENSVAE